MQPEAPEGSTISPWMIGAGVAVLGIIYYLHKKNQAASGGSAATAAASTPYGLPATGTGVLEPIVINSPTGVTAQNAPIPTPAASSGSVSPSASSKNIPGFLMITNPAEGSAYANAGKTIYILPPHAPYLASALLPWSYGGKIHFTAPPGSVQYVKVS